MMTTVSVTGTSALAAKFEYIELCIRTVHAELGILDRTVCFCTHSDRSAQPDPPSIIKFDTTRQPWSAGSGPNSSTTWTIRVLLMLSAMLAK